MDKIETNAELLARFEDAMTGLCRRRAERLATAGEIIRDANREYDQRAIPLARQISKLRDELEAEKPKPKSLPPDVSSSSLSHDPEWSQEDIDHYYELKRRGNKKSVTTNR